MPNPEHVENAETEEMETEFNEETPIERSPHRTVLPPDKNIVSGADSMRAVIDNIDHNIAECKEEMVELNERLAKLSVRLEYLEKLQSVSEDYQKILRNEPTELKPRVTKNGK